MTRFTTILEKRLSEKLQESRHFIEQVACSTPDILYVLSLEKLKTAFINQRGIDVLGFDHDLLETVHPEDFSKRMAHFAACKHLMDEDVKEIDIRMRVKDGTWHWFRVRDIAFKRHPDSTVAQIIGIAHDIHEEKLAEDALIQSVAFTERIANATPDILYVFDLEEKKIVFTNDGTIQHLGVNKKYIYDNGANIFSEALHPEDFGKRMAHLESCASLKDNEVKVIDVRLRAACGEWRWFRIRDAAFRRNELGRVTQTVGSAHDIHEEKVANEALEKSRQLLQATFDASLDTIQVFKAARDDKGDIVDFEWVYYNRLLLTNAPATGHRLLEKHPYVRVSGLADKLRDVVETGNPARTEWVLPVGGEKKWYNISVVKLNDGVVVTAEDITEKKQREELIRLHYEIDRQAGQLANLGSWELNLDTGALVWGDNMFRLLNHEPGSLEPSIDALIKSAHPEDRELLRNETARVISLPDGPLPVFHYRVLNRDGSIKYLRSLRKILTTTLGRKVIGTVQDITTYKRTEEELRKNAHFVKQITELTPDVINVFDFTLDRHIYINHELKDILGIPSETICRTDPTDLVFLLHPDDVKTSAAFVEALRNAGDGEIIEYIYRLRDVSGGWRWFHARGKVFARNEKGEVTQYMSVNQDITAREKSKEKPKSRSSLWSKKKA